MYLCFTTRKNRWTPTQDSLHSSGVNLPFGPGIWDRVPEFQPDGILCSGRAALKLPRSRFGGEGATTRSAEANIGGRKCPAICAADRLGLRHRRRCPGRSAKYDLVIQNVCGLGTEQPGDTARSDFNVHIIKGVKLPSLAGVLINHRLKLGTHRGHSAACLDLTLEWNDQVLITHNSPPPFRFS